jgi:hypothetical protein
MPLDPLDNDSDPAPAETPEFAFWSLPQSATRIIYSIPLFYEIDFVVNEGYRKIPHGGIEVGGLLFGSVSPAEVRLEAFRIIECEHASGPSFFLSDRDLEKLDLQLASVSVDPDLKGLQTVGWFLAHTRSGLELTSREAELFDRLFPQPQRITVLVKPERFQPTRFGFLERAADGSVPRNAAPHAIILPLPSRTKRTTAEPLSSISAPASGSAAPRPSPAADADAVPAPAPASASAPTPTRAPQEPAVPATPTTASPTIASPTAASPTETDTPPLLRRSSKRLMLDKLRAMDESASADPVPASFDDSISLVPTRTGTRERRSSAAAAASLHPAETDSPDSAAERKPVTAKSRLLLVLPLAALFGCIVGYLAYLRLPSAIIPLDARGLSKTVLVSWPPAATRNAVYAALRVDDATPVLLSAEERSAGQIEVSASSDIKVELISRNWLRDSRGIVRYIRAANLAPPAQSVP